MQRKTEAARHMRTMAQPLLDDGVATEGQLQVLIDLAEAATTPETKAAAARAFLNFQVESMDLAISAAKAALN